MDESFGDGFFYHLGTLGELGVWLEFTNPSGNDPGGGEFCFDPIFSRTDRLARDAISEKQTSCSLDWGGELGCFLRNYFWGAFPNRDSGTSDHAATGNDYGDFLLLRICSQGAAFSPLNDL